MLKIESADLFFQWESDKDSMRISHNNWRYSWLYFCWV